MKDSPLPKTWVFTFRVEPPPHTVMVRYGATVFDAYYSRLSDQWFMVAPGGGLEKVAEPPMMFVLEDYAKRNARDLVGDLPTTTRIRRSKKPVQLSLFS